MSKSNTESNLPCKKRSVTKLREILNTARKVKNSYLPLNKNNKMRFEKKRRKKVKIFENFTISFVFIQREIIIFHFSYCI